MITILLFSDSKPAKVILPPPALFALSALRLYVMYHIKTGGVPANTPKT